VRIELAFPHRTTMMTVRRFKMSLMSLIFKNDTYSLFSEGSHYVTLFQKFVDKPINDRPSLFALTMSIRWRLLFPTLCWAINTKSMGVSVKNDLYQNEQYWEGSCISLSM
jgi:hypothetical protein